MVISHMNIRVLFPVCDFSRVLWLGCYYYGESSFWAFWFLAIISILQKVSWMLKREQKS